MITKAQVSSAIGSMVGAPTSTSVGCIWEYTEPTDATSSFEVLIAREDQASFEASCQSNDSGFVQMVPGVGDDACAWGGVGTPNRPVLAFLKGCASYAIGVYTGGIYDQQLTDSKIVAAEKQLALDIIAKL